MIRAIRLLAGLGAVLLTACALGPAAPEGASLAPAPDSPATAAAPTAGEREEANYPVRPFPTQTLAALLAAEFAGVRGDVGFALQQYREQARVTTDPQVIERAAQIAQYENDEGALRELADLWIAQAPDNPLARELAAATLVRRGEVLEALPHVLYLLRDGDAESFRKLTAAAAKLPPEERRQVLAAYEELLRTEPEQADLLLGTALLLWEEQRLAEARELAERALKLQPDQPANHLLYAQLLDAAGLSEQALDHLEEVLPNFAADSPYGRARDAGRAYSFSRAYVRMLFARRDMALAVARLRPVVERHPEDGALRLGLALAYGESGQGAAAREQLRLLIEDPEFGDDARFQLAQLEEAEGEVEEAAALYRRVEGNYWLPATARLTRLLAAGGNLAAARQYLDEARAQRDEQRVPLYQIEAELLMQAGAHQQARELLTQGLQQIPDSVELLYARSLAHEELDDIVAVEADLRAILAIDAENASALNALGYSLANHTDRFEEAQALIEQALALEPDDAAIMDSLGWVLYRRGEHQRALVELQRAAALLPDPEVAAHLGEVLWVMGDRERAKSIWGEALKQFPEDPLIRETMQRLQADS